MQSSYGGVNILKLYSTSINPYDIIIENIRKEYITMSSVTKEKWEVPKYSKSEINKAGQIIANPNSSDDDCVRSLEILNNWRASHAYPLQIICSNLRSKNPNAIVVQRLKRLKSIVGKIERFPDMNLYRMQDLGGCRVIVDTIDQVYNAIDRYKNSRIRHKLKREYDYIQNPKSSGYRSYHMVYQYHSDRKDTYNKNMLIEIQFRTKLQHIWATAVEMMGIYTKSNLKSSQGDDNILRFFTLVSSLFALKENMPVCPETSNWSDELINEIQCINNKEQILDKLLAINTAINESTQLIGKTPFNKTQNYYYILKLDYQTKIVNIYVYNTSDIELASKTYDSFESVNDDDQDVVLVSAKSFSELRTAYPNYFVDIKEFVNTLDEIFKRYNYILDISPA